MRLERLTIWLVNGSGSQKPADNHRRLWVKEKERQKWLLVSFLRTFCISEWHSVVQYCKFTNWGWIILAVVGRATFSQRWTWTEHCVICCWRQFSWKNISISCSMFSLDTCSGSNGCSQVYLPACIYGRAFKKFVEWNWKTLSNLLILGRWFGL